MLIDPSGRGPSARQLSLAGLALTAIVLLLLYLLGLRYTGRFEDKVGVVALLTSTGDGLPAHADVKFRGMIVGSVAEVQVVAKGERQRAELDLKPAVAGMIPAQVTARVIPSNIFGVTAIELVDNGRGTATLRAGAEIPEDTSEGTVQLQTTLSVLRDVLDHIQPEKLGRVLATLADALDPAARVPGSTIERLDRWLTEVHAVPGVGNLLGDLGRAATALSVSAPDLVGVLSDSVTTARTLTERREQLVALLTDAGGAVDSVNSLFARNPDAGKEVVSGVGELFGSLAEDPSALPETAANFNVSLQKLRSVFSFGPSRQMVWKMDVSFTPFQQYTAADCPRYGTMSGPRCGGASIPEVAPPQEFPAQQQPGWLGAAGPKPVLPALPALPAIPGLPMIPGLTAPAAAKDGAPETADPGGLRGTEAVAAIVGGKPNAAQYLLLTPLLAGGAMYPVNGGGR
ncbi:Mce family protein [Nocardia brasiliensis NBRC 14402]|uniref:MlaD family protein n=1 Tax=Nocardia brasiliensis TaxID=37326 RepID=UPI0002F81E3D|nr:MCE family protein [Nocardia brasiliensis]ASF11465.1 MCE family protein [Nocardia brasiliensis]GAJ82521.1 Mce family protein [Nocardia brasiliensis NBRC 14402]SUB09775.1 virulence factor Mce family protein [Nocardia brasiliensis]